MTCYITQYGTDGFGHQLHGLFSCMILHNCEDYYFDGPAYLNRNFSFDHIDTPTFKKVIIFLRKCVTQFIKKNKQKSKNYKSKIHCHEIYKIPERYDSDIIYTLDNAYYFDRIPEMKKESWKIHSQNIKIYSQYFRENLPRNKWLKKNSIVIHIRLGDSVHRKGNQKFREDLVVLMTIFKKKYPHHEIYIHSDGKPDFLNQFEYKLFGKQLSVIDALSDFIWCDIFVSGVSSLSIVSTFFTHAGTILIPDSVKHSVPKKAIRFKEYLNQ